MRKFVAGEENKQKALEIAVSQIEKRFVKGAVMRLGEEGALVQDVSGIPTGSLSLDIALGVGGIPRGRVIEIYGPESSGKTTYFQLTADSHRFFVLSTPTVPLGTG